MTVRGSESLFAMSDAEWGVQSGGHVSGISDTRHDTAAAEDAPRENEVQWVNTELHEIASTIEALQSRLEQANSRLSNVEEIEAKEFEIGRLFVEAQQFIEGYLSKIEVKIHEVLSEAEAKARQILVEATEGAQEIRGEAQKAAFASTITVKELQSAIAGFTTVNADLLKELGTLNSMLTTGNDSRGAGIDPSSHAELHSSDPE
jgi:predicted ribosome quality control (RQC) complex YloA/Tae2 family protein